MIRPVVTSTTTLSIPARPATKSDVIIADDLLETLAAHKDECVGMAANMIGESVAIIVYSENGQYFEMFNPRIVSNKGFYKIEEGCLSLVGMRETSRFKEIVVEWEDRTMNQHSGTFNGFTAQIIQHEIDHLRGIII